LSLAESADWKTALNRKQCDWRCCARRAEYLTAFRRLELEAGLGKLNFGFFHGLSEIERRSEFRMFNRLFCETQFIKVSDPLAQFKL
jgi:hypothetical protein